MNLRAKDIMVQDYAIIAPNAPVREAARIIFEGRVSETGYKPFGIMVVNEKGRLVGMISMTDILFHVRPPAMKYDLEGGALWEGEIDFHLEEFNDLRVEQIMSSPVITVSPEDHMVVVMNKMIKNRVRRLPVEDGDRLFGIVYLSHVYYHTYEAWLRPKQA